MLSYTEWMAFLTLAIAATLSPGPAVLLAIRNGSQVGFRRALSGIAGNVSAMLTYALLATAGVAIVFNSSLKFALWVQILGGGYLVFFGIKLLFSRGPVKTQTWEMTSQTTRTRLFIEAYLVGLSNPKALLFYSALFPQFVKPGELILVQSLSLALTFAFCSFIALCLYSWLASRVAARLSSGGRTWNMINRGSGAVFIGLGGGLILNSSMR